MNNILPWSEQTEALFKVDLTKEFSYDVSQINATVICDSINKVNNKRLVTLQLTYPRYILSEVNTHRILSKNSSSSRACPASKVRNNIRNGMFAPVYWGANQRGMSANTQLTGWRKAIAKGLWKINGYINTGFHYLLECLGVHKQICNRIVEPWVVTHTVITGTEWDNFFQLRYNKSAQPEFIILAKCIHDAIKASSPRVLENNEPHLPYITNEDRVNHTVVDCIKVSVARCCRVSYKNNNSNTLSEFDKDVALFERLFKDHHMSPFEHVGFVCNQGRITKDLHHELQRNFRGWYQFRGFIEPTTNVKYLNKFYNIDLNV